MLIILLSLLFNLEPVHNAGYTGEGITIAVIDAGFYHADRDSLHFPAERIRYTYDYLNAPSTFYGAANCYHGSAVLSTMLTRENAQGEPLGTAPDASYMLIRTEDVLTETRREMSDLADAIHRADSLGADIITISLGYHTFDAPETSLTYDSLDGSSIAARAATQAARNGRLVFVSAGNDGNKDWHYLSTPADADSILTVGAVQADSTAAAFSSFGPTADGRLKPEISAMGAKTEIYNPKSEAFVPANGTSFACPEVAGMAACLWQAFPEWSAMQLRDAIIRSAHHYPTWDAQTGYGIPDAWAIFSQMPTGNNENVNENENRAHKILHEGRIVILHNGRLYDLLGHEVGR